MLSYEERILILMKKALKILALVLLFSLWSIYYVFYTDSGVKKGYFMLGYMLSIKNNLDVKIVEINLHDYPYFSAKALVQRRYTVDLFGEYRDKKFDINYTITSDCIESNICRIDDDVNISGTLKGASRNLNIRGHGKILGGDIVFKGLKKKREFRDVEISLMDVSSAKIFELIGEKAHIDGDTNATLRLSVFSKERRRGLLAFNIHQDDYHTLPLDFEARVNIHNYQYTFSAKLNTATASFELFNGEYKPKKKLGSASYLLDIKNTLDLEPLLKFKLNTPFMSQGELKYDKKVSLKGFSESLGGIIALAYADKNLSFTLDNIPLSSLLEKLSATTLFDANITGRGLYCFEDKNLTLEANLSTLSFIKNKITKNLDKTFNVDLSKEVFTQNIVSIKSIDEKLYSNVSLQNRDNHIILTDMTINNSNHAIDAHVDIVLEQYSLDADLLVKIDKYTSANDTYIKFDGRVQKYYEVKFNGIISAKWMSMDYALSSHRLPSHLVTIEDDVNITGHLSGSHKRLQIEGQGTALEGDIYYKAIKSSSIFEDIHIEMDDVHALKLSTLLGISEIPSGRADIKADFELFSTETKKGILNYHLKEAKYETLPLDINSTIKMDNDSHTFDAEILLADAKLTLTKGTFKEKSKKSEAFYTLDIPNLEAMKPLLGATYKGSIYAVGRASHDEDFIFHGLSKSFEGLTEFHYEDKHLSVDLSKTSFKSIISLFVSPPPLDAITTGSIEYNFDVKKVIVDAKLQNAHFIYSDSIENIYQEVGINLLQETFTDSNLSLTYEDNILDANIELHNAMSHISIRNVQIDTKSKRVDALFDINIQQVVLSGKVYGTLDEPKINLNMQKLVRHQMDKQLDSFVGQGNRKMMESMPMGDMSKDMASGVGGAFMEIFF